MIIEADFLNHWKVKALGNAVGELAAIRALISLWGHCQKRRAWEFLLTPAKLAGICDFHGDKEAIEQLWNWMKELQFLDPTDELGWFQVHQWGEVNVSLVSKWAAPLRLKAHEFPPRGANDRTKAPAKAASSDPSLDPTKAGARGLDRIGGDGIGLDGKGKDSESIMPQQPGSGFAWGGPEAGWVDVTDAVIAEFALAYPAVNIRTEFHAMHQWLVANPEKTHKRNWRNFANQWLRGEQRTLASSAPVSPPRSPADHQPPKTEKKEKGAAPADFPWRQVAEHEGWEPVGEWEQQTARSRSSMRETWRMLPATTKAAMWALADGDVKKEEGAQPEGGDT